MSDSIPWKKQCAYREMVHACSHFAMPGTAFCAYHDQPITRRPRVVCLCGSTRFWETFRGVGLELTLAGAIVLSIGICAPDSMVLANPESPEGKEQKQRLDWLHKRKIDLADSVLVLDVDGYIGDSTRSEIEYAEKHGKPVYWLSETGDYQAYKLRGAA